MKRLILLFILTALMPVCNSMYSQSHYEPVQGTYRGVSYTGETAVKPLLSENYISFKECNSLVAIDLSFPNMTECTWYAFTPRFDLGLTWYGSSTRDPQTHYFGPVKATGMNFAPKLEYGWVSFDLTVKTSDGKYIQTSFKFIIRP